MRVGVIAEGPVERIVLALGFAPVPLADTMVALLLARTVMTATKLGVFEVLADGPLTVEQVATRCHTEVGATAKLLFALSGARYVRASGDGYSLDRIAKKWLLHGSDASLHDAVLHRYLDAALMENAEEFVRTGESVHFHARMSPEEWALYQRGQRAHAVYAAPEVARRVPLPAKPLRMLDIGGGHGYFSVALCRRYPELRSTVLDLPQAAAHSAPRLAGEDVGDRIDYHVGDARREDLGKDRYDLVLMANLVHHFDAATNRDLTRRIAVALRPGGFHVVLEFFRPGSARRAGQTGALLDFYFGMASAAGTWSVEDIAGWQRAAGLVARRPRKLFTAPGQGLQAARKP